MVYQNAPDHLRAEGIEMRAILALDAPGLHQFEVRLVRQDAGLDGVARP
jgi:hypothetical protein